MRLELIHLIAGLVAAIAFTLAFIAAGAFLLSVLFALIGAGAVGWLAYMIAKRILKTEAKTPVQKSHPH